MKTPDFWYPEPQQAQHSLYPALLKPMAHLYQKISLTKEARTTKIRAPIPVLSVGNLVMGGAGKTPIAIELADLVQKAQIFLSPFFVTRGYKGKLKGPERVHEKGLSRFWGDEALMLAQYKPTILARKRALGAQLAADQGADCVILDDGLQHHALIKDISFCVIDGATGLGNQKLCPAGPLRQTLDQALPSIDVFLFVGSDAHRILPLIPATKPLFFAQFSTYLPDNFNFDQKYIGFCGIAHPAKFEKSLKHHQVKMEDFIAFGDHHEFSERDIEKLIGKAVEKNARLITTEKDYMRLPPFAKKYLVDILKGRMTFEDPDALINFMRSRFVV
jgi:tetraacyldisaccharide 4'-kinase